MEQEYPYLRIGTAYYKIVQKPLASGDRMTLLLPCSVECIKQDHGKSYLSGIPKYDGFCFVPSHLHYKRFIGNFYNRYHPFIHVPKIGQPERTLAYLGHIFGDQLEYGLDYLKILLEIPMQMLPIPLPGQHRTEYRQDHFFEKLQRCISVFKQRQGRTNRRRKVETSRYQRH
ncbi:hypothetical protein G7092_18285 [Mucilaginibacter sp. HC2]|uniref:hypothetical protein n=1 Tax=Mucilaginibacter inviolabilis TaxID=2714892 RepID=UPI001407F4A4|nr:hypothetical protein [Mucilaginibacter inviolabilis]NHA05767.1 hypothetical protein [Mucilaginibacter inviolabilis]